MAFDGNYPTFIGKVRLSDVLGYLGKLNLAANSDEGWEVLENFGFRFETHVSEVRKSLDMARYEVGPNDGVPPRFIEGY